MSRMQLGTDPTMKTMTKIASNKYPVARLVMPPPLTVHVIRKAD